MPKSNEPGYELFLTVRGTGPSPAVENCFACGGELVGGPLVAPATGQCSVPECGAKWSYTTRPAVT